MNSKSVFFKNIYPIHPLIFGVYPVLMLFLSNIHETRFFAIYKSLLFSVGLTGVVFLLMRIFFKTWAKSAPIASFFLLGFFSYGHIYGLLDNSEISLSFWRHRYIFPLWLGGVGVGWVFLGRSTIDSQNLNRSLNVISVLLLLFVSIQIGFYLLQVENLPDAQNPQTLETQDLSLAYAAEGPDVYYIILDSYSREDLLRDIYQLENRTFIHELEAMGFVVPDCTQSNYVFTVQSLSSSLNMKYLDDLEYSSGANPADLKALDFISLIKHSQVRQNFEQMGYQTITFKSVYPSLDITDSAYYYDFFKSTTSFDKQETFNFYYLFLRTTALRPLVEYLEIHPEASNKLPEAVLTWLSSNTMIGNRNFKQYQQNLFLLDTLIQIPKLPGKKFVYAHLFTTHQPFVFNQDGTFRGILTDNEGAYYDQILYTNKRILEIVSAILATSPQPPIIIIQGDHGIPWTTERVKILNAYYLPNGGSEAIYSEISPVNTFRIVFNQYFGGNYELLPDISYYSTEEKPLDYTMIPVSCVQPAK